METGEGNYGTLADRNESEPRKNDDNNGKIEALRYERWTSQEEMNIMLLACLDKMEANPEEMSPVAKDHEVLKKEVEVETIRAQ
jgi:hypothetical protein